MPDQQQQRTTTTTSGQSGTQGTTTATGTRGNQAGQDQLRAGKKPTYTGIVHFGLNGGAKTEADWMNAANADQGGAKSIRNQKEQDVLTRNQQRMDLATDAGRTAWLATLGLEPKTLVKVDAIIKDAGGGARDELGQLVETYAQAETGVRRIDRLVLSGHNVGSSMWGDDNGSVPFDTFVAMKEAFPKAAAQVKHLLVSACYSGGEHQMDTYKAAFPSLMSIMAYTGSSPGTYSGAQSHLTRWEKNTEKGDGSNVDKDIAKGTRKGENVSTWNQKDGYQGDQPMQWYQIESELSQGEATYDSHFSGETPVTDPQNGPLRTYYNLVQRALRHPELDSGRRTDLGDRRDRTIRLLFFHLIRKRFAETYASQLREGYGAAGQSLPDYAKLDRKSALAAIDALGTAGGKAHDLLERGLKKLDGDVIPEQWV